MTGPRRVAGLLASVLTVSLAAAGCTLDPTAGESSGTPEPSPSSSSTQPSTGTGTSGTPTPTDQTTSASTPTSSGPDGSGDAPPFTADTSDDTGDGTGDEVGTLVDLRVGGHDGFDRVVIELDGPDIPSWQVGYVERPIGDPSGVRVDVEGDAYLQVLLIPVAYPEDGESPYDGPSHVAVAGTEAVTEAVLSSIFEGELQAFIGIDGGERPFRVYGMSDPARVVIEVRADEG